MEKQIAFLIFEKTINMMRMKKKLLIVSAFAMIAMLWSCGGNEQVESTEMVEENQEQVVEELAIEADNSVGIELQRYYIKSGQVKYEISGSATGSSDMYFDNYGMKEADFEKSIIEVMGQKTESDKLTLMDGEWVYSVDFLENVGSKMANPVLSIADSELDLVAIGRKVMEQMGGKQIGNEDVLGYDCEVWEMQGAKIWIHKGILLNTEADMMGMKIVKKAIKIDFDIDIPADKFKVPEGINMTELPESGME